MFLVQLPLVGMTLWGATLGYYRLNRADCCSTFALVNMKRLLVHIGLGALLLPAGLVGAIVGVALLLLAYLCICKSIAIASGPSS